MNPSPTTTAGHGHGAGQVMHLIPLWVMAVVLLALLVLTVITVASVWLIDLGAAGNVWMAMIIATIKSALVVLYFMHLRYEKPFIAVVLISALAFVALFVGFALMDGGQYRGYIAEYRHAGATEAEIDARYARDLAE